MEGKFLQDISEDEDVVAVGLQRIPAWSQSQFKWEFHPPRRGILPTETPEIANGFPFGLYRVARQVEVERDAIVWPQCVDLDSVPQLTGAQFNIDGSTSDRPGNDGDVIGARDYRRGDSLRQIHWAQTARRGKWIVRERQTHAQKPITIVVDLAPQTHTGVGSGSSFEWAIRTAATIGRHFHCHHSHVRLICGGLPTGIPGSVSNRRGLEELLDYLAKLPDLELARAESENGSCSTSIQFSVNEFGRAFVIGTDKSRLFESLPAGMTPIIFSSSKFDYELDTEADSADRTGVRKGQLSISNPADVPQQIAAGWEKVCHAS